MPGRGPIIARPVFLLKTKTDKGCSPVMNLYKMPKFLISNRRNGEFQFSLKDHDGYEILRSEGYSNKNACICVVELIKKNCGNNAMYDRQTVQGKYYFDLKTSNGYRICTSDMFDSIESRDKNIDLIKILAPVAMIDDQVIVREFY